MNDEASEIAPTGRAMTTHLRNRIQAAVGHARAAHDGPLSVDNAITNAVVRTVEAHADCSVCKEADFDVMTNSEFSNYPDGAAKRDYIANAYRAVNRGAPSNSPVLPNLDALEDREANLRAAMEALRDEWDEEAIAAWSEADRLHCGDVIADQITRRAERLRIAIAAADGVSKSSGLHGEVKP